MRFITLGLILVSVACAKAPQQPVQSKSVPTAGTASSNVEQAATVQDQISASDVAEVMTTANPPADASLDMASMESQVQAAFAQSNLAEDKKAAFSEKTVAVIAAANAGDQEAVTKLSNALAKEALGGAIFGGFGLDAAGAVTAIMDLITAVMDLDVAGIIDAVMDLIAALGA